MTKERRTLLSGKIKGREFLFCKRFNDGEWREHTAYGEVNGEIQVSIGSRGNKRNAGGRRIRSNDGEKKNRKRQKKGEKC